MSTNSYIGIIHKNKSIDLIYCHNDGYPSHHIPILMTHYNTPEKAQELINLGDISCLCENIAPTSEHHSFDHPEPNTTIAYHRDRGEEWESNKPKHYKNKTELMQNFSHSYIYLFDEQISAWTYTTNKRFTKAKLK